MVSYRYDDGSLRQSAPVEDVEEPPDLRVGEHDLTDVRIDVDGPVRLRRIVRRMGIIEVGPEQERGFSHRLQPIERVGDHRISAPLQRLRQQGTRLDASVDVEALRKTAVRPEHG